jgi:hypothetical protein
MRRQRFAGEQLEALKQIPSDVLAAATEALKQAQTDLKPDSGGRLGPGSQQERDEGAAARARAAAAVPAAVPTVPTAPTAAKVPNLGDLFASLGSGGGFEMPQFEMPAFEMPSFEMPDFESMFPQQQYGAPGQQPIEEPKKVPSTKKKSIVRVGNKSYNLARKGGPGMNVADIKAMKDSGWTNTQIRKAATQAPRVAAPAQRMINSAKAGAANKAKQVTAKTSKVIGRAKKK